MFVNFKIEIILFVLNLILMKLKKKVLTDFFSFTYFSLSSKVKKKKKKKKFILERNTLESEFEL